jgi:flagellar hook-basal body complex protein FliE
MIPPLAPLSLGAPQQTVPTAIAPDSGSERPNVSAIPESQPPLDFGSLLDALKAGGAALDKAESAENAFAAGTGGLQEMVFERAKADSIVSIAAAVSSRVAQSLNTLVQMQL